MLKVGDKLPAGTLQEFIEVEGNGCSIGPNSFDVQKVSAGKTIAVFGLPGAYTESIASPLVELMARYAHTHGPFVTEQAAQRFGELFAQRFAGLADRAFNDVADVQLPGDFGNAELAPFELKRRRARGDVEPLHLGEHV